MIEFVSTIMLSIVIHIFINFVLKDSPGFKTSMLEFLKVEG